MNFQLKDARSGGTVELNTGMYGAGDGESTQFAGNVGLSLGATGFANLSLEYGNATRKVTYGIFFRNPNTRLGVFSNDGGRTLLVGDVLAASGIGSADCPTVTVTDLVPDPVVLRQVADDPNCFTFQELFPGGFTPQTGGTAAEAALAGGVRGFTAGGFNWDLSGSVGMHRTDFSIRDTINASLGLESHGLNIHSWFDPTVGDLVNNAVIPSVSPVALLRGGAPLQPETSLNYTAGVVLGGGPFTLTADYFRIDVSDRIGITSNFTLTPAETAEVVAGGFEAAESVRNYRFFTNAFGTTSQGIDVVSTWTPLALRGNTVVSAVFNHTDTEVTDNDKGLLDGRRLAEYAYALPRTRWYVGLTQRLARASLLGRLS